MKAALPGFSLVTPPKAPNSPLVSVGTSPEVKQSYWFICGAERPETLFLHWLFHCGERDARALGVATQRVVTCTEDGRVAQMSGAISAPTVSLVGVLNPAIHVAVRGWRVEGAPLVVAVSPFLCLFAVLLFGVRRLLIELRLSALSPLTGPLPSLLCLQDNAVWQEVSDTPAAVALHVADGMSVCLHGDAAIWDRFGVGKGRRAVDEHGVYHVSNVYKPKVSLLVADVSHPLVLFRERL